jgi:hypothetical protein
MSRGCRTPRVPHHGSRWVLPLTRAELMVRVPSSNSCIVVLNARPLGPCRTPCQAQASITRAPCRTGDGADRLSGYRLYTSLRLVELAGQRGQTARVARSVLGWWRFNADLSRPLPAGLPSVCARKTCAFSPCLPEPQRSQRPRPPIFRGNRRDRALPDGPPKAARGISE